MAKQRRQFTEEFKREAVRLMRNRGTRTVAQVADGLGINGHMLHRSAQKVEHDAVAKAPRGRQRVAQQFVCVHTPALLPDAGVKVFPLAPVVPAPYVVPSLRRSSPSIPQPA
ncbi:MAG TPA: transposase [Polyangiaceae bacterium]|nr:transposase [Polyangiaceae bacterium]